MNRYDYRTSRNLYATTNFEVFDRRAPYGEILASCHRRDDAEKIVSALNEQARVDRLMAEYDAQARMQVAGRA